MLRAVLILLVPIASRQIEVKAFRANSCSFNLSERSPAEGLIFTKALSVSCFLTLCVCVCCCVCVAVSVTLD